MRRFARFSASLALLCTLIAILITTVATPTASAAIPLADAGADQTFPYADLPKLVTLTGGGSDPDGGALVGYEWTTIFVPDGSAAALSSATAQNPTFTADEVGTYRFCLEVEDDESALSGTTWTTLPTVACTNVTITTQFRVLTIPAKAQRNYWTYLIEWAEAIDDVAGDLLSLISDLADTGTGTEGADLIGTDTKTNLDGAETVEEALTYLDTMLSTTGPYLPLAGGATDTMTGTIYSVHATVTLRGADGSSTVAGKVAAVRAGDGGVADGSSPGGAGGAASLVSGTGGAATATQVGGAGGALSAQAGTGGAGNTASLPGAGGALTILGGTGGAGTAAAASGAGGAITIRAGAAGADGGAGAGTAGTVTIGATNTSAITIGATAITVDINGTLQTDNVTNGTNNTYDIGSTTHAYQRLYTRSVRGNANLALDTTTPAAGVTGYDVTATAGTAGVASGAGVDGGTGGACTIAGGTGGAGSGTDDPGNGGNSVVSAGRGGAGTATQLGARGGNVVIEAGQGGATGGAGAGGGGDITVGGSYAANINVGNASATTAITGTVGFGGLSAKTFPIPFVAAPTTATTGITSATAYGLWSLPASALTGETTVLCWGSCATTDGDATDAEVNFRDNANSTDAKVLAIPDNECGDTTGTYVQFVETFAASDFGSEVAGIILVDRAAGTGQVEIRGLFCMVY